MCGVIASRLSTFVVLHLEQLQKLKLSKFNFYCLVLIIFGLEKGLYHYGNTITHLFNLTGKGG